MHRVRWLDEPAAHDYDAAREYLELLASPALVARIVERLRSAPTVARKAKDLLRASELVALDGANEHVAKDLHKIHADIELSPVLLVRGDLGRWPLVVADGYHRICAVHLVEEDTDIACRITDAS